MTEIVNIIGENDFNVSKFDNNDHIITYDNKDVYFMLFDTRDSIYKDGTLTINRLPPCYIRFISSLQTYCGDSRNNNLKMFSSELFNENIINSLILIEFKIKYKMPISYEVIKYDVIKHNLDVSFIKQIFGYNDSKMTFIPNDYFNNNSQYCMNILKYLHKYVKLNKNDLKFIHGEMIYSICAYNYMNVLIYFHQTIEIAKKDFEFYSYIYIIAAAYYNNIEIIKYLHNVIGITKQDYMKSFLIFSELLLMYFLTNSDSVILSYITEHFIN